MRCPGQDAQYWTGEVAFETPCPKCGGSVEFFKDESSGRCGNCGHRFRNPRVSFDCAKWCAYAEQCVGIVPDRQMPVNPGEGALASLLIQAVKQEYDRDQTRLARALTAFQYARELLSQEGGDPRIVFAATLCLEVGMETAFQARRAAEHESALAGSAARVKRLLTPIGLDADTIECVWNIIRSHWTGEELDTTEFKVVWDSYVLAELASSGSGGGRPADGAAEVRLRTGAGRRKAESLLGS